MSLPDRLLRHFNLANLILLAAAILIYAVGVHPLLTADPVRLSLAGVKPVQASSAARTPGEGVSGAADRPVPPVLSYLAVSEQNLFHPSRKMPPGGGRDHHQAVRPDLVLHGTLLADGFEIAYITDRRSPRTTPGRGERQTALKKGDLVGGYSLIEIGADRIVLARGEDRVVVPLDSPEKREAGPKVLRKGKSGTP